MRITEIQEAKKKPEPNKPRDPNWRDMEALRKSGAAGSHGDKTKTIPRKEKYKKISMEDATAGSTSSIDVGTVVSPHIAIGDKKARNAYGKKGMPAKPPKAKMQKPTDNALDMTGVSVFGGTLKR